MEPTQRQRIEILLRSFSDARETLQRGDAGGKMQATWRWFEMPAVWHDGDYEILADCMEKLHVIAPGHYKHLVGRYLAAERKAFTLAERQGSLFEIEHHNGMRWVGESWHEPHSELLRVVSVAPSVIVRARKGGGDARLVRALVVRWPEWVVERMAETGVDFLCWTMPQRPRLPQAIYEAVGQGYIKVAA